MSTFDEKLEKYQKELQASRSMIGEAFVYDLFRSLLKGDVKNTISYTYKLENSKQNLPILRQKFNIDKLPIPNSGEIFNQKTGKIEHPDTLKIVLYNAFSVSNDGLVGLENILMGKIGQKDAGHFLQITPEIPKDKANQEILTFLKQNKVNDIIKGFDSYEKAQKASKGTSIGLGIRSGIINTAKQAATNVGNTITTKGVNYI